MGKMDTETWYESKLKCLRTTDVTSFYHFRMIRPIFGVHNPDAYCIQTHRLRLVAMILRPMPQRLSKSETCPAKISANRKVTQTCAHPPRLRGGCLKPETVSNFCMRLLPAITCYYNLLTDPRLQRTPLCSICTGSNPQELPKDIPSDRLLQTFQTFAAGPSTTVPKAFTEYFNFEAWRSPVATDQHCLPHCLQRLQRVRRNQFMKQLKHQQKTSL